jgi:septal ring factor EnvC (AmiA/AmiB activator)
MNEIVMERDLVALPAPKDALATFTTEGAIEPILADVRRKVDAFLAEGHTVETSAGRDAIKSFAHKVTKSKTALEEVGKELAAEAKKIPGLIDATRREIKTTLDAWRDEVRKPLTDWEQAEDDRVNRIKADLEELQAVIADTAERPSEVIRERIGEVQADFLDISEARFGEYAGAAAELKWKALAALEAKLVITLKREADAAELAILRAQAEERAKKDREEQIAREAAEKAKAEAEAKAQAERDAAAKREADLKAAAELAEREKKEAEERAVKAEEAARAKALADSRAREEAAKREQEAREADKAHRATVNREVLAAFVEKGISADVAKEVIVLIATRTIPHISINY